MYQTAINMKKSQIRGYKNTKSRLEGEEERLQKAKDELETQKATFDDNSSLTRDPSITREEWAGTEADKQKDHRSDIREQYNSCGDKIDRVIGWVQEALTNKRQGIREYTNAIGFAERQLSVLEGQQRRWKAALSSSD
ncbi:DUF5082 family protein [Bacillus sp. FSL W7-1360]